MLNFKSTLTLPFHNSLDKANHYGHMKSYNYYMSVCVTHRKLMI